MRKQAANEARLQGLRRGRPVTPSSSNGNCCSFADGLSISDVDWDTKDGHYRVLLHGEWINVPNSAVVTEPNRYGPAVVWPYMDTDGNIYIRCFLPGAGG